MCCSVGQRVNGWVYTPAARVRLVLNVNPYFFPNPLYQGHAVLGIGNESSAGISEYGTSCFNQKLSLA